MGWRGLDGDLNKYYKVRYYYYIEGVYTIYAPSTSFVDCHY